MSWISVDCGYRERYPRSEAEHHEIQRSYFEYLGKVAEFGFENVPSENGSFQTDPMTFAGELKGRPIFMINALRDKYIPEEAVIEFWQALGEPRIRWIPSGHAGVWLHYPSIRDDITDFLRSALILDENSPPLPPRD